MNAERKRCPKTGRYVRMYEAIPSGYRRDRYTGMLVKEKSWSGFTFSKMRESTFERAATGAEGGEDGE